MKPVFLKYFYQISVKDLIPVTTTDNTDNSPATLKVGKDRMRLSALAARWWCERLYIYL